MLLLLLAFAATPFSAPDKLIPVGRGSRLAVYCTGKGPATVILESGFGGGSAATWFKLFPILGAVTRTCAYDRAGYGFSTLGRNLPRDLDRAVADLHAMLRKSGERPPYILVGHSNGGLIVSKYARLYANQLAGVVLLDAAVSLPEDQRGASGEDLDPSLRAHLDQIRRCSKRALTGIVAASGDECADPGWYAGFPPDLASTEIANRSKPDYWRAYLSEAEANYGSQIRSQALPLPARLPVRVFIANSGREIWMRRQERVCRILPDCVAERIPAADHLVHNAAPGKVADAVARLAKPPGER